MLEDIFDMTYTVAYLLFYNSADQFAIARIKEVTFDEGVDKKTSDIVVQGIFPSIQPGDTFHSKGKWIHSPKYGWQIEVYMTSCMIPANVKGIKRFLKRFVPGIGQVIADLIVDAYGLQTLDKIRGGTENLTCLPKIGKKKAQAIYDAVIKHDELEKLTLFLFQHGISNYMDVIDIYENGGNCLMIQADPYSICDILSLSKFPIADKIAYKLGIPADSIPRVSHAILFYLNTRNYRDGDLYVSYKELQLDFVQFLITHGSYSAPINKTALVDAIRFLADEKRIVIENIDGKSLIFPSYFHYAECYIAETMAYISQHDGFIPNQSVDDFLASYQTRLEPMQEEAVRTAAKNRISIVTGGPGTGKTYTINAIIQYFLSCNPKVKICLCAPTGRAAKRMTELSGVEASTIHRAFGIFTTSTEKTNDPIHSVGDDFVEDLVIVDEFSMVDVILYAQLLTAIKNSRATLVLVGDDHQLPSVGPGRLLHDIIESGCIPVTTLTTIFRHSSFSQIHTNAHKIIAGKTTVDADGLTFDISKQDCFFLERKSDEACRDTIIQSIQCLIEKGTFSLDDIVVLSPVHKGVLGDLELNKAIQDTFNPKHTSKAEISSSVRTLRVGDRVIQTVNNYDLDVCNGEMGWITDINMENETVIVTFPNLIGSNTVTYNFTEARELMLAYAMTIHKSQGGEYPCVFLPVFHTLPNISRSIVYTGLTRAKESAVFVGEKYALDTAINRVTNMERNTRLACRLRDIYQKDKIIR